MAKDHMPEPDRSTASRGEQPTSARIDNPIYGSNAGLRVCYFGTYEKDYPGNRVLIEGLRKNGVSVFECHVPLWEAVRNKSASYFRFSSLIALACKYLFASLLLLWKLRSIPSFDVLIVGFNGHLDVFLAKGVAAIRNCPLVMNPMLSIYDTLVIDKQYIKQSSVKGKLVLLLERLIVSLPDAIFLDASEHFEFFNSVLHCPRRKYRQVFFGADDRLFFPLPKRIQDGTFNVLFYGKFQPLQGVPYIVRAAKLLENDNAIRFRIIGNGPDTPLVKKLVSELEPRNVEFIEWVEFGELQRYIAEADVCLGIFGTTDKVRRCIANKVIQALAMAKPTITGDCTATRELLANGEHAILCEPGSPEAIARSILLLKNDAELRERLAKAGHSLFLSKCSPQAVGYRARQHLEDLVYERRKFMEREDRDSTVQAVHR